MGKALSGELSCPCDRSCCRTSLQRARYSCYNFSLVYVRASGFVRAIASTFVHGFQNNLAQLFSLTSRGAI